MVFGYKNIAIVKGGVFIRKFLYYCQLVLVLSVTWWVLHGYFSPLVLISGPMVSLFVIYICEKYILKVSFYEQYYFNLLRLVLYIIHLVYHIYLSGLSVLPTLFTGKARLALIEVPTRLKEPYLKALVSNSITLTPGTISISVLEEGFEVLWLNPVTTDPERAGDLIKGVFEKPLLEVQNE